MKFNGTVMGGMLFGDIVVAMHAHAPLRNNKLRLQTATVWDMTGLAPAQSSAR